jgi:2,3-bisphosphoglycerate-dependent phosphoglycerate mutase
MPVTRLIITRHGETDWNAARRIQGMTDVPMNARGEAQSEALAEALACMEIGLIFSSDLNRAVRTAEIIAARLYDMEHIRAPLLRERNWGALEGKNLQEIEDEFPGDLERMRNGDLDFAPRGGESRNQLIARIDEFIGGLITERAGENILIVTHGGVCGMAIKRMMGIEPGARTPFRVENCSINIVDRLEDGFWIVETLNCIIHLQARELV